MMSFDYSPEIKILKSKGAWSIQYTMDGELRYQHGVPTEHMAMLEAGKIAAIMEERKDSFKISLMEWFPAYERTLSNSTAGVARRAYKYLLPKINPALAVQDITLDSAQKILSSLTKYEETCRAILSEYLKYAVNRGMLQINSIVLRIPQKKKGPAIYTREQYETLMKAIEHSSIYLEYLLYWDMGLNAQEIFGLQFSDFSDDCRTVDIRRIGSLTREHNSRSTFTSVTREKELEFQYRRVLSVPEHIVPHIRGRAIELCAPKYSNYNSDYVCPCKKDWIRAGSYLNTKLYRMQDKVGAPHVGFNDLKSIQIEDACQ